jgi:uncharacterized metal-binding protein YceD (DUF177 family)
MPRDPAAAELRRPLPLGLVGPAGREEVIEADAAERAALARRFRIPSVGRLRAELHLRPEPDGAVLARGRLEAAVTQECVVTLEPVAQAIDQPLALRLLPPGREPADGPEDLDEVESGADGVADLGEAVAEQLALALDPYPRAPGAELPAEAAEAGSEEGEATAPGPAAPFAALAGLRRRE